MLSPELKWSLALLALTFSFLSVVDIKIEKTVSQNSETEVLQIADSGRQYSQHGINNANLCFMHFPPVRTFCSIIEEAWMRRKLKTFEIRRQRLQKVCEHYPELKNQSIFASRFVLSDKANITGCLINKVASSTITETLLNVRGIKVQKKKIWGFARRIRTNKVSTLVFPGTAFPC